MYGKKVKLRFLFVFLLLVSVILAVFLLLKSLEENVVYFLSPTEIKNLAEIEDKKIRVGGMVKKESIIIKTNLVKEQNKFTTKFGLLDEEKVKVAQTQSTNRKILASRIS